MSAAGTLPTDLPMTAAQPVATEEVFVRLLGASKKAWRRMSAEVRMVKEVKIFVRSGAAFNRPSYHVTARRSLATMGSVRGCWLSCWPGAAGLASSWQTARRRQELRASRRCPSPAASRTSTASASQLRAAPGAMRVSHRINTGT